MGDFRYPQFCALSRAAEIVGERWTLLILRDLMLGPQRFSDLRRRLGGVSSSVLAERLAYLEERELIVRRDLAPPAASSVYELTEAGRGLGPTMIELARWGVRFMYLSRAEDHFEPDWLVAGMTSFARKSNSPALSVEVRAIEGKSEAVIYVWGGRRGTQVSLTPRPVDAKLAGCGRVLLAVMGGVIPVSQALADGRLSAEGDLALLESFPQLFDVGLPVPTAADSSTDEMTEERSANPQPQEE